MEKEDMEIIEHYKRGKTPPSVLENVPKGNRCHDESRPAESQATGYAALPRWINFNGTSVNLDHVCSIDLRGSVIDIYFDPKLSSYKEVTFRSEEDAQEAFAKIQRALGKGD